MHLEPLPISDEIKEALLNSGGICGALYNLVLKYDNADWKGMAPFAKELQIEESVISQKYLESAEYVNGVWKDLMKPYASDSNVAKKPK